jgi:N-acyl-D-aspartate/D-glutamate deacylase
LIQGEIIAAVERERCIEAGELVLPENRSDNMQIIDAAGRCVTPGFVDAHRHRDYAVFGENFGEIELAQGITTAISGACGLTPYPYKDDMEATLAPVLGKKPFEMRSFEVYKTMLKKRTLPINIGGMIGSCAVRASVKGWDMSPFSLESKRAAKKIINEAMEQGAFGVSLGLMYLPEFFSSPEEIAEIVGEAKNMGGVLTAHIRGEGDLLAASVEEAIYIARKADMPLTISHFKCCGAHNWGNGLYRAIAIIEYARKNYDVAVDFYPYNGGATTILSLIPPGFELPALITSRIGMGVNVHETDTSCLTAAALKTALSRAYAGWDNYIVTIGFKHILLNSRNGMSITDVCSQTKQDPYKLLCEILSSEERNMGITVMSMSPEDVDTVAQLPYASVISDALYPIYNPHPRLYAAFTKILRDFVRERRVLTLPEAIRKMTALPAERMGILNRGRIKVGYAADVNIFALDNICDNADFSQKNFSLSTGMDYVFVNGKLAWDNGRLTGYYGQVLER